MDSKIQILIQNGWNDKYLCKLAVLDHIRECLEKDNYLKATDIPKGDAGYAALDKELMDLNILLNMYFADDTNLREARIEKFIVNQSKSHS